MTRALIIVLVLILALSAFPASAATTAEDREPVLKAWQALLTRQYEISQATIDIQQRNLQYAQLMEQKRQEMETLKAAYDAALGKLREKCVGKLDEKTLECDAPAPAKRSP